MYNIERERARNVFREQHQRERDENNIEREATVSNQIRPFGDAGAREGTALGLRLSRTIEIVQIEEMSIAIGWRANRI